MRHFIDINDWSTEEIEEIFELTDTLKAHPGRYKASLRNQTLLMLFAKPSTRTRVSFEAGMDELGGHGIYFEQGQSQMARGESLKDTSIVLSRYVDGIMGRLFEHDSIVELAEYAQVPVINGLTDLLHPCQALADLYTLREKNIDGPLAYIGDGNNVANSLMQACARLGRECRIATPEGYEPDEGIQRRVADADILITNDPVEAADGAAAVYTDVFVSMGEEEEGEEKFADFEGFQVNPELMSHAARNAVFMHCLPAHRGEEVHADVMDSEQSVVYDEAENRKHVQKALIVSLMAAD